MNRKQIQILRIIALVVLIAALALLVYSLLPGSVNKEVYAITPTFLIPPAVAP
jgi:hypothetical protein